MGEAPRQMHKLQGAHGAKPERLIHHN
jgi:hypothetical protein